MPSSATARASWVQKGKWIADLRAEAQCGKLRTLDGLGLCWKALAPMLEFGVFFVSSFSDEHVHPPQLKPVTRIFSSLTCGIASQY